MAVHNLRTLTSIAELRDIVLLRALTKVLGPIDCGGLRGQLIRSNVDCVSLLDRHIGIWRIGKDDWMMFVSGS